MKTRGSAVAAMLSNSELLEKIYNDAVNSSGEAEAAMETAMSSLDSKLQQLQNSYEHLWQSSINSSALKFIVDVADGIVKITDKVGLLSTALIAVGGVMGAKKLGAANLKQLSVKNVYAESCMFLMRSVSFNIAY